MNYVTDEYMKALKYDRMVAEAMLSFLPEEDREHFSCGLPPDKLAEILTAYARNTKAANKHGYDLADNVEVKYAKYLYSDRKWQANIASLRKKRGNNTTLCVIISFPTIMGIVFRYFVFPAEVWEKNIKSDQCTFCFQTNKHKWYLDYEVSRKEYGL